MKLSVSVGIGRLYHNVILLWNDADGKESQIMSTLNDLECVFALPLGPSLPNVYLECVFALPLGPSLPNVNIEWRQLKRN